MKEVVGEVSPNPAELTFGQKAVELTFNPSGDLRVTRAKQLSADLIDLVEEHLKDKYTNIHGVSTATWTVSVFRTAAFNAIIAAQMAVVKFLTWTESK